MQQIFVLIKKFIALLVVCSPEVKHLKLLVLIFIVDLHNKQLITILTPVQEIDGWKKNYLRLFLSLYGEEGSSIQFNLFSREFPLFNITMNAR